jgi:acyl dehydratase
MAQIIDGLDGIKALVGQHLGYSDYLEITQERVNTFADATGDHQWIHVDVERAKAGPFGGPIAHGYLTLSLGPSLAPQIFSVTGISMAVNYGAAKVRFPSPVPVGSKLRLGARLAEAEDVAGNGLQVTMEFTFEVEGAPKPSCVAELIFRYYA